MRKSPGLTITVLLTLVLGIGANTAIFTVDYATLLAPAPYPNPEQLVNVWSKPEGQRTWVSIGDFIAWKRQATAFQDLNVWGPDDFNISTPHRPEFVEGMRVTPGYYGMMGTPLFLGRNFVPEEGTPGRERVVILSHQLWQRIGANPQIIDRKMRIDGEPYTVVGVMAAGTADRRDEELMVPLVFTPAQLLNHDSRGWVVTGRLKPGIGIQQAQANLAVIAANLARDYPKSNKGFSVLVDPIKNDFFPSARRLTLWLLLGAVGFLMLIACVNVAGLLLAKGITRQREVAIRRALGATRAAIFTQFLTESLVLAILGCLLGVAVGFAMLRGLIAVIPAHALPPEADLRLNVPVLLVMLAIAMVCGVLFGCAPAWYASRLDPALGLKDGGRSGIRAGRQRLRLLVIAEFALALPLLAGAGLTIGSFENLTHVDIGIRADHVLGFYLASVSLSKNPSPAITASYYRRVLTRIRAVPGVAEASALTYLPLDGLNSSVPFTISGQAAYTSPSLLPRADVQSVTPDYFRTFGVRIVKGRAFADADNEAGPRVAMVNDEFVRRFLPGVDPLTQRVATNVTNPIEWQIIGVSHRKNPRGSRVDRAEIVTPFWQQPSSLAGIGVRTVQEPALMVRSIAAVVNSIDPDAALYKPRTMEQIHDEGLANDSFTAILFVSFAVVALLLSTVGVYSVMAFSVTQRTREIAVRMALGATRHRVIGLIVKEGFLLASAGSLIGLIGAYFVGRAMQTVLFDVKTLDLTALGVVSLLLLSAAVAASYLPAFNAASEKTMDRLRSE